MTDSDLITKQETDIKQFNAEMADFASKMDTLTEMCTKFNKEACELSERIKDFNIRKLLKKESHE